MEQNLIKFDQISCYISNDGFPSQTMTVYLIFNGFCFLFLYYEHFIIIFSWLINLKTSQTEMDTIMMTN